MSNVVISTRVRLARNLKNYPFPCKLSQQGREEVIEKVRDAVKNGNSVLADDFSYIKMSELDPRQSVSLVEKRLVSPEFVSDTAGRALLLSSDERLSIMLNEEDHIRLQVITPGLSLEQAYDTADKLDTLLDERLDFAFDEKLGYLTQCPTNLGTGMRASVMLHLPALEKSNAISRIAGNLSKLGLTMRGAHGEGTEPQGALYQLSNQVTLGISEKAAIENLKNITAQLAAQEEQARERLCKSVDVQDTIARSLGIL
ncbi:MAG: ATP--guanido phosphotransferase, partial [Ruminococcus sp.]|nr:ATP--guanido phosphotransferase [Ruminococcus sp.]